MIQALDHVQVGSCRGFPDLRRLWLPKTLAYSPKGARGLGAGHAQTGDKSSAHQRSLLSGQTDLPARRQSASRSGLSPDRLLAPASQKPKCRRPQTALLFRKSRASPNGIDSHASNAGMSLLLNISTLVARVNTTVGDGPRRLPCEITSRTTLDNPVGGDITRVGHAGPSRSRLAGLRGLPHPEGRRFSCQSKQPSPAAPPWDSEDPTQGQVLGLPSPNLVELQKSVSTLIEVRGQLIARATHNGHSPGHRHLATTTA